MILSKILSQRRIGTSVPRMFYSSSSFQMLTDSERSVRPVSRKNKKIVVDDKKDIKLRSFDFLNEVDKLYLRIKKAFEPLKEINEKNGTRFNILENKDDYTLTIEMAQGKQLFWINYKEKFLVLNSNTSGPTKYQFVLEEDYENGRWLSMDDAHDIRGMIVRDYIRYSPGCPDLNDY